MDLPVILPNLQNKISVIVSDVAGTVAEKRFPVGPVSGNQPGQHLAAKLNVIGGVKQLFNGWAGSETGAVDAHEVRSNTIPGHDLHQTHGAAAGDDIRSAAAFLQHHGCDQVGRQSGLLGSGFDQTAPLQYLRRIMDG